MKRKNKIITALAIGAVVLVVASGVVRCSLSEASDVGAEPSAAQVVQQQEADVSDTDSAPEVEDAAQGGFADLKNTSWESEDGKSALSIIEGALIETSEQGSSILYYTLDGESQEGNTLTATLSVSRTMTGDEEKTVAVVRTSQSGVAEIVCDKLACKYLYKPVEATGPLGLVGATDELYNEFGKGESDFVSVISGYAKSSSPSATTATWSKEVWIDYGSGTRLTNFTLNDAASTIICVQLDATGKLGVL